MFGSGGKNKLDKNLHLRQLPKFHDVSLSEAVDDPLSLSGHVLILLTQRCQFGEFTDRPAHTDAQTRCSYRLSCKLVYIRRNEAIQVC